MEKMDQVDSNEIIFVLDDERFRVDKAKLMKKSQYFSALFSGQYRDSTSTEFPIKLKWSTKNLLAFTFWINENDEYDKSYYSDLESRFEEDLVSDVMELVDIANYFVVDKLVQDLENIIIKFHLNPEKALYLFLHVRYLPLLEDLRDLSYALVLERFTRIPRCQLLDLPYDDFIRLVANVNLQCDKEFLKKLMTDWVYVNSSRLTVSKETYYENMRVLLNDFSTTKNYQDVWQCAVSYKNNRNNEYPKAFFFYIWDGVSLKETEINTPFKDEIGLNGTRVLFRGFDMYVIGGQFAYKEFNYDIWKYSFITERWYYVTSMPQALRHMTTIFWDNRLYLIGGTSRYRLKFENQIYYDFDEDTWSDPEPIQGFFTGDSLACIVRNKIFVLRSLPYFFDPELGTWERLSKRSSDENEQLPITNVKSIVTYDDTILFLATNGANTSEIWSMHCDDRHLKKVESSVHIDSMVVCKNEIIGFTQSSCLTFITTFYISSDDKIRSRYCYRHSHIKEPSWDDINLGFFNTLNPESLYNIKPELIGNIF